MKKSLVVSKKVVDTGKGRAYSSLNNGASNTANAGTETGDATMTTETTTNATTKKINGYTIVEGEIFTYGLGHPSSTKKYARCTGFADSKVQGVYLGLAYGHVGSVGARRDNGASVVEIEERLVQGTETDEYFDYLCTIS